MGRTNSAPDNWLKERVTWFALGMIVTGVAGTIGFLTWLRREVVEIVQMKSTLEIILKNEGFIEAVAAKVPRAPLARPNVAVYPRSEKRGCDEGEVEAFCDTGDRAIGGGGSCGACDGGVGRMERSIRVKRNDGTEGWQVACDENNNQSYDGGTAEVVCLSAN